MSDLDSIPPLIDRLRQRVPRVWVTLGLVGANLLVFVAMLVSGAGLWHSPNGVQLAWGANFGPATQNGEWWRLGSALFLHFGVLHLVMNMWALWDGGQLVERMFGPLRFSLIYFLGGIVGNLLSLVSHHGQAVSGGASGAIFGIYGAMLVGLWRERHTVHPHEFRWLFWGAMAFSALTVVFGLMIPGIDNAAHIGGFLTGLLSSAGLACSPASVGVTSRRMQLLAWVVLALALSVLIGRVPEPAYRWSDEVLARKEISAFIRDDAAIGRAWQDILVDSKRRGISHTELAGRIDSAIGDRYDESFEHLSSLAVTPGMPSAVTLETLRHYAELRRDASRTLADGLRNKDSRKIREAMVLEKQARELHKPVPASSDRPRK